MMSSMITTKLTGWQDRIWTYLFPPEKRYILVIIILGANK